MSVTNEIKQTEEEIYKLVQKLEKLRNDSVPAPVKNYPFKDLNGEVSLLELFAGKEILFMIHNMGQGCRYCTLWADGLNAFLPHLEDQFSVVLVSKDNPETQRKFANSRNWRFRMASHKESPYIQEQNVEPAKTNSPGLVCYVRKGNEIYKKNSSVFGPRDLFCSQWHVLSLAGVTEDNWVPQFNYWERPTQMDDGEKNL